MNEDLQKSPMVRDIQKAGAMIGTQAPLQGQTLQGQTNAAPSAISASTASLIFSKIEALADHVEALAAKDEGYIKKYWPIAAGIVIALTRFL